MISRWLAGSHVARWWGDPREELAKIRDGLCAEGLSGYLVLLEDRPLAYLQTYDPDLDPDDPLPEQPLGTCGIDLFLGEADDLGRGHGSAILERASDVLLIDPFVARVVGDPAPENHASIRAFAKAGFQMDGERDMPWGRAMLMVREQDYVRTDPVIRRRARELATRDRATMTPNEKLAYRQRYGICFNKALSREEIFRRFLITRERIRQIEAKAMRKLGKPPPRDEDS